MLFSTAQAGDSLTVLQTNKTIEASKPKSYTKMEPSYNITNVLSAEPQKNEEATDIFFTADSIENDSNSEIVIASGDVEIIRENLTLRADKIIYNQATDNIHAEGNVILLEENGNVVFAETADLKNHLQHADVYNIKVILLDKTRLAARSFHKKADDRKVLRKAVYTPCDNCRASAPLWQIKAHKVIHNTESQDIEYQHAFLEIKDFPVFYTPYFSHPDPSVKHRSGFLFPRMMSNNYLGAAVQPQYFWDISPQQNMILNPIISSDKGIVYSAIYNKYFQRGELNASGSIMEEKDDGAKEGTRGNLFLYARKEINNYWVADTDINYASDYLYLKDLSLPKKDDSWLTSRIRAQAFDNRNYAAIEGYYYDILSYDLRNENTPYVLPIMTYENISKPNSLGIYNKNTFNTASVYHEEDNVSHRLSMINSWELPYTGSFGARYRLTASLKSDLYYIGQYKTLSGEEYTGTTARVFPQLGLEWHLPFIKNSETSSQILEPIIVAAFSPNQSNKEDKIPNEDSEYSNLNDTNIFDLDRYSGYDRNDTGSRISYGFNWSFFDKKWGRSAFLLAQSYEFNEKENIFNNQKNDEHFSDYVGRIYAQPNNYFSMNYRFKIDKEDYDITYSELSSALGNDILRLNIGYIYFPDASEKALYKDYTRKEIYSSISSKLTRNWGAGLFIRQDLEKQETISNGGNITYEDECARFAFSFEKEFSDDPNAEEETSFYFSFFLKTLGGVGNK